MNNEYSVNNEEHVMTPIERQFSEQYLYVFSVPLIET